MESPTAHRRERSAALDDEWTVPGYSRLRELGVGHGGRVVLAVHDTSGVPVAIKYLSDRLFADKTFLTRFRVEARLLAGIRDPHLVRLYEYVETRSAAAIIMELVDGVNLRELIRREGPTGPEAALAVLKATLLGLAAAHATGVVHRDVKPANVLIDGDGHGKLAGFGIAVRAAGEVGSGGVTGGVPAVGTPAYLAPERWAGGPATQAADVYAAAAVFFECLTGRPPYERKTVAQLADAHANAPIPIKQVPEPLWGMFARGLAKEPRERPPTAAGFLAEVEEAARAAYGPRWETRGRNRLVEMAALLVLLFPLAEPPGRIRAALGLTRLSKDNSRTLAAAGVAAFVILAGAGAAALLAGQDAGPPTPLAAPMATPRPVPPGAPGSGPGTAPPPNPIWSMPGGLPSGAWTAPPLVSLPTTAVANPSPIGGVPPDPGGGSIPPSGADGGGGDGSPGPGGGTPTSGGSMSPIGDPTTPDPTPSTGGGDVTPTNTGSPPAPSPTADPSGSGPSSGGGGASPSGGLAFGVDVGLE
jgi:serine/threonine-protein kinase